MTKVSVDGVARDSAGEIGAFDDVLHLAADEDRLEDNRFAVNRRIVRLGKPEPLQEWTDKLLSDQEFRVIVQSQGWSRKHAPALLQCFDPHVASQAMWSRQVILLGRGRPWVSAHSLIPASSLQGPLRRLCKLQERPLGEFLFRHPSLQRRQLEIARTPDGWGRRSVFYLFGKPLLVAEFFLPALLRDAAQCNEEMQT